MHVSLYRRSHRVGLSMQYLLWLCFGLLAVVPWQVIRGQDGPVKSPIEQDAGDRLSSKPAAQTKKPDRKAANAENAKPDPKARRTDLNWLSFSSSKSLIFRGQTAAGTGPDSVGGPGGNPDSAPATGYDMTRVLGSETPDEFLADQRLTGRSGQAYGVQYQVSGFTGPAIGRKNSILPVQAMPYLFLDNSLVFADIRGFSDFVNGYGMNLGGGYRYYFPRIDRIVGVNGYFDYDNTSGALFRELGFGVESLGALYDVRANAYLPVGTTDQQLSLTNINGTQNFVGHFLQVDQAKLIANALHGFDSEIGIPMPGRVGQRHNIKVFGGGYWFEGTDRPAFGGWKTRIQGNVLPSIAVQLQVSNDDQFKTNVVFGATWTFGGYQQQSGQPRSQFDRMTEAVQRQYNMVVGQVLQINKNVTVDNPTTGDPYFFEHVSSNATGPVQNGTVEHPFLTVADAQKADAPGDIIFVHANSVYNGVAIALQPDVRVLGESANVEHTVSTAGGTLLLPHPTTGVAVAPLFTNSPGDGVVLANNAEFSGFQIGNAAVAGSGPTGVGIFGFQVENDLLREDVVSFSGGEGVTLTQTAGTITFQGDVINAPASGATAFHVNGLTTGGTVTFTSDSLRPSTQQNPTPGVINNTGGLALLVENTAAGSLVDFTGSAVNDNAGQGILITNDVGQFNLGDANLTNELGIGINFLNDSGAIIGNGNVTIAGAVGDAINIQNLASTGQVSFLPTASISISGREARGINLQDNAGTVGILSPVIIAAAGNVALPAIEYQGSTGNAVFGTITISNGGRGIVIDPDALGATDSGQFTVRGTTTITAPGSDAITVDNVDSVVTFNTTNITNRGGIGIEILNTRDPVSFTGLTTIANTTVLSNFPGIDIRGNGAKANISFQNVTITGANGPAANGFGGVGVNIGGIPATQPQDANPGQVSFTTLNVAATSGIALFADNVGVTTTTGTTTKSTGGLLIQNGAITSAQDTAVRIENTAMQVKLTSVTSTQSPTTGIFLQDNAQFNNTIATALNNYAFTVTGGAGGVGSGGTISQAGTDGIFLNNTGSVSLTDMNINQSTNNGVDAQNMIHLLMNFEQLTQNVQNGVFGSDVQQVDISNTLFTQNGSGGFNQIQLTANAELPLISPTNGAYVWNIINNSGLNGFAGGFVQAASGGDNVLITNTGRLQDPVSGLTTPLILNFSNNNILMNSPGTAALNISWIGPESGNLNTNNITLNGDNAGIFINNTDLTFLTNFNILGSNITGLGQANTGLLVTNNGPTDLFIGNIINNVTGVITPSNWNFTSVGGNVVNAAGNVAMSFTTGPNSNLDIFSNTVTMNGNAVAGVQDNFLLFKFLENPTVVTISNNLVTMTNEPVANGEGVEFLATNGVVNLNGLLNNSISINGLANQAGNQWVFVTAGAATTGTFIVNGFFVP